MKGLEIRDTPMGFRAIRLHYSADPDKDVHHPDEAKAAAAQTWFERQRALYSDPNVWDQEMEINFFAGGGSRVFPQFTQAYHQQPLTLRRHKTIYRGWDFGWHCFPIDFEILTAGGWKGIVDVAVGESVATLNAESKVIEFQDVTNTIRRRYVGPMYHWATTTGSVDLEVTADHRVAYVTRHGTITLKAAKDIPSHYVRLPSGRIADGKSIGDARAVLLGLFLSEGSTRTDGKHYYTWIWQNNKDPWMDDWLLKTGVPFRYYSDKRGGRGWCVAGKALHESLNIFGHAKDKFVPDEIKTAPPHEIGLFLEAYMRGDGTRRGQHAVIYTASRRMADDLQELYLRLGIAARITEGRGGFTNSLVYRVYPRDSTSGLRRAALTILSKDIDVACVTVPNGLIMVRRNGIPMWCGNCPSVLFAQIDTQDRLCLLKELVGAQQTTHEFAADVLARSAQWFPDHAAGFEDFCDPAGQQVKSLESEKSERRDTEVLSGLGIHAAYQWGWNRKDGRTLIHRLLQVRSDGTPSILVDPTGCPLTSQAFLGRYVFPTTKDGRQKPDPDDETHPWADVMAATRYLVIGLHKRLGLMRYAFSSAPKPVPPPDYQGYGTPIR